MEGVVPITDEVAEGLERATGIDSDGVDAPGASGTRREYARTMTHEASTVQLRPYQQQSVEAVYRHLRDATTIRSS